MKFFNLDNIESNFIAKTSTRVPIIQVTKENFINITRKIHVYEEQVRLVKEQVASLQGKIKEKEKFEKSLEEFIEYVL